ncbi:hypothetical protein JOS77_13685 [Chromobacterium haemolyticum]|nr:hypothetical protein JOS77_13685 [Chromobacterium haemolyticum]
MIKQWMGLALLLGGLSGAAQAGEAFGAPGLTAVRGPAAKSFCGSGGGGAVAGVFHWLPRRGLRGVLPGGGHPGGGGLAILGGRCRRRLR